MNRKDRFKLGDKVVIVKEDGSFLDKGVELTIAGVDGDGIPLCKDEHGDYDYVSDLKLEYADIYNSPLWKAMR